MQITLGAHYTIDSCFSQTTMNVVQGQDVSVGKHWNLDVLAHILNVVPISHPGQRTLLLSGPTVDSQKLAAGRLQHLGIPNGLLKVLEDANLASYRNG